MHLRTTLTGLALITLLAAVAGAQDGLLLAVDFEQDEGGFVALDDESTVWVNREEGVPYAGEGCLQVDYFQRAWLPERNMLGLPGTVALPIAEPLPGLAGVSFALRSEVSTPVLVMLVEGDDGPRYNRLVWCEAGQWHEVELSLEEFGRDTDGPEDPDGQLTAETVTGLAVIDAGGFLRHIAEQTPMIHIEPAAQQALRLDDLKLLSTSTVLPADPAAGVRVNGYDWPPRGIAILGGERVAVSPGTTDDGGMAVKIDYELPAGTLMGIIHQVPRGSLAGVTHFTIRLWTTGPMDAFINIEEKRSEDDKCSYQAFEQLPGADRWQEITVPVSALRLEQGHEDPNGRLDLEQVETIIIGDAAGIVQQERAINSIWLDEFTGMK